MINTRDATKRRKTEKELIESEERYRMVVEHSSDGIALSRAGIHIYVNRRFLEIFGYDRPEEIIGKPVGAVVHPDDREKVLERGFKRERGEGVPVRHEFRGLRKDGATVFVEVSGTGVVYHGEPVSLAVLRDITGQRQMEESFRASEALLMSVLAASPVGTGLATTDRILLFVNESMAAMLGYTREQLVGKSTRILYPSDEEFERVGSIVYGDIESGGIREMDCKWAHRDGRILDIYLKTAETGRKNSPSDVVVTSMDITERKAAERRLRETEERYRTVVEESNDGVGLDRNGRFLFVNQKFLEIFGYEKREDVKGESILSIVHPEDRAKVTGYARRRLLGEPVPTRYEFKGVRSDGTPLSIEVSVTMTAYDGEPARLSFLRDNTRRKMAEEGLKLDERRLESLLKISQYRAEGVEELLDLALEEAITLTRSKIGYIYFYNEERREFTLNTWSKDVMNECTIANPQRVYGLEQTGVWGEAVRQRKPVILNDYKAPHPLKKGYPEGHAPLSRFLTIPVIIEKKVVAVTGVANKATDYDDSDVRQLTLLMDSVWQFMERKNAEQGVKNAAEEWRATFDAIKDPIMLLDRNHRVIRANRATASLLNRPIENIVGNDCHTLMHGSEEGPAACPLARMDVTKVHEEMELCDGEKGTWFSVSVDPILDGKGEIAGVVHIARDITTRKRAEEAIRKSEEKYRNIFENTLEGIFQVTPEGRFISVNPAFARMCGFDTAKEFLSDARDRARQLFSDPGERVKYTKTLREEGFLKTHETRIRKKDGNIIWVSISAHGVKGLRGKTVYYDGTAEDITKRKAAELELRNVLEELESKNRELEETHAAYKESQRKIFQQEKMASIGQLAAGVAHEINNPMGFIISNLNSLQKYMKRIPEFVGIQSEALQNLLEEGTDKREPIVQRVAERRQQLKVDYILEDSQSLISESLDGADRVKRIVQDLKSFSRADDTEHTLGDINKVLESTLNIVWNELKYKATVNKEYGSVPPVRCNPGQLSQVFMNILVNASHAILESGEITIKTWHDDTSIYVAISDTGTGIPEDQLQRIFEPFFTTKEVGKGTGLGLSIVYDIMKKHKGEVGVTSVVGKGTTFTLKIPKEDHSNG